MLAPASYAHAVKQKARHEYNRLFYRNYNNNRRGQHNRYTRSGKKPSPGSPGLCQH